MRCAGDSLGRADRRCQTGDLVGSGSLATREGARGRRHCQSQRFVDSLKDADWSIADSIAFPDHHRYTDHDVEQIAARFRECGATAVFTTDKDAVRFEALGPLPFPLFRVPLLVEFDPPDAVFESVRAVLG